MSAFRVPTGKGIRMPSERGATERIVLIGGGLAAGTAAQQLREHGFDGSIHLVTAEHHAPYLRPPLSKEFLLGKEGRNSVFLEQRDWYADHDVTLITGTGVERIGDGEVEVAGGRMLPFDRLLLAPGAEPRAVGIPGEHVALYLRTLDDSEALKARIAEGEQRVAVIGAGWIGLEAAAAAREYGNDVTVITHGPVPLERAMGAELGGYFRELHERNGVRFELDTGVVAIETDGDRPTAVRSGRGSVPADVVLIAAGVTPRTALATSAGIELDDGIPVDERMRTSREGILAAGDAANAWHPVLKQRMRNEHWATAIAGGKVAAATLSGRDAVLDDIPYFYSDQFDLGMEYSGYPPLQDGAELLFRGDRDSGEFVVFWLREDRVVAGMNVNVWDVNEEVQRLIRDGVRVDRHRLADPSVPLAEQT